MQTELLLVFSLQNQTQRKFLYIGNLAVNTGIRSARKKFTASISLSSCHAIASLVGILLTVL